jgi:hypothetical protein
MVVVVVDLVVHGLMVVGKTLRILVVVGAWVVVVVVLVLEEVVSLDVVFVFLSLLRFLVFCVFEISFSDLRFHHFLFSLGVSINLSSVIFPDLRKNPNPS